MGFASERPDKQYREGPDNLWAVAPGNYFVIECKNEVKENRNCISQSETGQMNNTYNWFNTRYPHSKATYIMIIPTTYVDNRGGFNCSVGIIKDSNLKKLKNNIENFVNDLISNNFKNINENEIAKILALHGLNYNAFSATYLEKPQYIQISKDIIR